MSMVVWCVRAPVLLRLTITAEYRARQKEAHIENEEVQTHETKCQEGKSPGPSCASVLIEQAC